MGDVAPTRTGVATWVGRGAMAIAALGLASAVALLVLRRWWPERYLRYLPTPALVIGEAVAIGDMAQIADADPRSAPVSVLEDRFPQSSVTAALSAALGEEVPAKQLAGLAGEWTGRHPECTDVLGQAVLLHRSAGPVVMQEKLCDAYLTVTHATMFRWMRKGQESDGCWPAASAPPAPGRWQPGRAAATAMAMLLLIEMGIDNRTPGRGKKEMGNALAALRSVAGPDGRCAKDPRDHALVTLALVLLYGQTGDPGLKDTVQSALDAARRDLDGGDCAWERDTLLAVLHLDAFVRAADCKLEVGGVLDHPFAALRRCWQAENPDPASPPRFGWREDGIALAHGGPDGLAAALWGFVLASRCPGAERQPPELAVLDELVARSSRHHGDWSPFGLEFASLGIMALPASPGTPGRSWLDAVERSLNDGITIGEPLWDATWGSTAHPRDVPANALLGVTAVGVRAFLNDRRFWERERAGAPR